MDSSSVIKKTADCATHRIINSVLVLCLIRFKNEALICIKALILGNSGLLYLDPHLENEH